MRYLWYLRQQTQKLKSIYTANLRQFFLLFISTNALLPRTHLPPPSFPWIADSSVCVALTFAQAFPSSHILMQSLMRTYLTNTAVFTLRLLYVYYTGKDFRVLSLMYPNYFCTARSFPICALISFRVINLKHHRWRPFQLQFRWHQ